MVRRHRIGAVIALVIYFLGTSLIIADCRRLADAKEQEENVSDEGIPHEFYSNSTSSGVQMPPIDLLMQMSAATDLEDFLRFIDKSSIDAKDNIVNRAAIAMERSTVLQAKMAACKPEQTVVPLVPEGSDGIHMYYPSCTRVNRCGGCCSHKLLKCRPTASETLTFQVIKTEWVGSGFQYRNKELVLVDQHTKCACDCAVQESDCNQHQKYFPDQCQCVCQNMDEREKCLQQSEIKLWDSNQCQCVCKRASDCTTGSYFNANTCECLKIPVYSNAGGPTGVGSAAGSAPTNSQSPEDRKKFIIKAIPLPSADTTKYSTTN